MLSWRLALRSSYARNVITLMTGTGLAQAVPIAISPILTRLYSPETFGVFAFYLALVSIISVLVTGRYELAILLPKNDSAAANIVALSIALSGTISVFLLLIFVFFNDTIVQLLGVPEISYWLYWVPAATFLTGVYQSLNYWNNRTKQYRRLAGSRVVQSGVASATQLALGQAGAVAGGLVGGQLTGQLAASILLANQIYHDDHAKLSKINRLRMLALAQRYVDFPKYLVPAHALNTASSQMPSLLLTTFFSSITAGFFMLTQRVLGAPLTLLAGALGDVFRQEASHAYIHNGNCAEIYRKTFKRLLMISLVPCLAFFLLAPMLFSIIFGQQWRVAGEYAQILTPMYFLKFITSPISQVVVIAEKQRIDLAWQFILFVLVVLSILLGSYIGDVRLSLLLFSASYCIMYVASGLINFHLALGRGWLPTV